MRGAGAALIVPRMHVPLIRCEPLNERTPRDMIECNELKVSVIL